MAIFTLTKRNHFLNTEKGRIAKQHSHRVLPYVYNKHNILCVFIVKTFEQIPCGRDHLKSLLEAGTQIDTTESGKVALKYFENIISLLSPTEGCITCVQLCMQLFHNIIPLCAIPLLSFRSEYK